MNVQLLIKEISPEIPVFKGNPGDFTIFTTPQSECLKETWAVRASNTSSPCC